MCGPTDGKQLVRIIRPVSGQSVFVCHLASEVDRRLCVGENTHNAHSARSRNEEFININCKSYKLSVQNTVQNYNNIINLDEPRG